MTVRSSGNPKASFKDRFLGTGNRASRPYVASFSASGGDVSALAPGNGYIYHTFTTVGPATFTFSNASSKTIEFLVVGGGGAGGAGGGPGAGPPYAGGGGGGGAGGLVNGTVSLNGSGSLTVTVGPGGSGPHPSTSGSPSTIVFPSFPSTITALGGGRGGYQGDPSPNFYQASPGGSSGGGTGNAQNTIPGAQPSQNSGLPVSFSLTYNVGNAGGPNPAGAQYGAGGGGAGAAGSTNQTPHPTRSHGGAGLQFPNFTGPLIGVPALAPLSGYFAGGGGGGGLGPPSTVDTGKGGNGGLGGGGQGGYQPSNPGQDVGQTGVTNSGGGGGGSRSANTPAGGAGGPGIVIIRYLA